MCFRVGSWLASVQLLTELFLESYTQDWGINEISLLVLVSGFICTCQFCNDMSSWQKVITPRHTNVQVPPSKIGKNDKKRKHFSIMIIVL